MRKHFLVLLTLVALVGCAPAVYYVRPSDWCTPQKRDSTIQFYSRNVQGWKFYLDPGHGGEDRYNHGPAYDVIEPDVNLRVGMTLAGYLRKAGATVILSRDKDTTVTLGDRPKLSNASGAQIFVSVHHNAVGSSQDKFTNFTSVWYHARETDPEYNACNQDIARFIQRDLAYAMGNPGSPSSFDGTMSDYMIYPGAGFAVLRMAEIPAVLIEGSFFSSEYEEQRLKREEFNTIEAWGAFKGLARYLKAGIPHVTMLSDSISAEYRPTLVFQASDSSGINKRSVIVKVDNAEIDAVFRPDSNTITCTPPSDLSNGLHWVSVVVRNGNGNACFPFRRSFLVRPPVDSLVASVSPAQIPPSPDAFAAVAIRAYDRKGNPCSNGTRIALKTSLGTLPSEAILYGGEAQAYCVPETTSGIAHITASAANRAVTTTLALHHTAEKFASGFVYSIADSLPIVNALVVSYRDFLSNGFSPRSARTFSDGRYILSDTVAQVFRLEVRHDGFFGSDETCPVSSEVTRMTHYLTPVAHGALQGGTFVLDARFGGSETGPVVDLNGKILRASDVTLAVAKRLQQLLTAGGATVLQVRKYDIALSEAMRIEYALNATQGLYLRIDVADTSHRAGVFVDPVVARKETGSALLWGIASTLHCDTLNVQSGQTPLFSAIPYDALTLTLPQLSDTLFSLPIAYAADRSAWGIYRGLLKAAGFSETASSTLARPMGTVPPFKNVILDNSLTTVSAGDGSYVFYGVDGNSGVVKWADQ